MRCIEDMNIKGLKARHAWGEQCHSSKEAHATIATVLIETTKIQNLCLLFLHYAFVCGWVWGGGVM